MKFQKENIILYERKKEFSSLEANNCGKWDASDSKSL